MGFKCGQRVLLIAVAGVAVSASWTVPVGAAATAPAALLNLTHTPGATNPAVTQTSIATTICKSRYVGAINAKVTAKTASKVFAEYSIAKKRRSAYAIDHLVPIDLGGTNAFSNLWPIPLKGNATPSRKAVVDAAVHKSVCAGFVQLKTFV